MAKIRVGIAGVGNCASSLVQGVEYYRHGNIQPGDDEQPGLMHLDLAGYLPHDIEIACAFDIDQRKVGQPLHRAIFAKPNKAIEIWRDLPDYNVTVEMGPVLDGVSEHMIVADGSALHTYLAWPDAQSLLNRRVAASPGDATPLLTYIDLVQRGGKPELIPGLADKTLAAIDRNPTTTKALADRSRLFDMLLDIVVQSRRAWATMVELKSEPKADGAEEAPVDAKRVMSRTAPVRDLGLLDEVCERLVRAGEGPGQTVAAVFEKAWLRTTQKRLPDAVECLQQILLDPSLGEVVVGNDLKDAKAEASLPSAAGPAWQRARERLVALLGEHGPAPYAAFDDEAARAIEAVAPLSPPDAYENLARRYPVALLTPELWRKAGEAHASAGNAALAKLAYGSGLAAAELNATIGRPAQTQVIARLAGELVQLATAPSDAEPMYRLLTRLAGDYPSLLITMKEGSVSPQQLADRLRTSLAARTALPRIGAAFSPQGVQALAAWEPLTPLCRLTAGSAQGAVIMLNETLNQVGLWATDAEDGALKLAWVRRYDAKPTVVRVTPDATCLFWPTSSGGYLESIINVGGKARVGAVAWKTQEFASLFPPPELNEGVGGGGFATPIDAKEVRPDDILILANAFEVVIVQRRGRAAVFAGETAQFSIVLNNPTLPRYAIGIKRAQIQYAEPEFDDINEATTATFHVPVVATTRGYLKCGRLEVFTEYPVGLFHAWSYVDFGMTGLVYPKPDPGAGALPLDMRGKGEGNVPVRGDEEFQSLRAYRAGDTPRQIAWKALARGQGLLAKEFGSTASADLWLDYDALEGLPMEQRLGRLTWWVLEAERMQVPMDFPAIVAVACLSGAVGRRAVIQPKRTDTGWIVTPNLWAAIVAPPGAMKSPCIDAITKPINAIQADWRKEYEAASQAHAQKGEEAELRMGAWREQFKASVKTGKSAPLRPEGNINEPKPKRLLMHDATFEALHRTMADNAGGIMVIRDELSGWMAQLDREGCEEERAFCLQAWNGNSPFTLDRIGRGSIHAEHCCLSMLGGIQPGRLRSCLLYTSDAADE